MKRQVTSIVAGFAGLLATSAASANTLADYRDDYTGSSPAAGWQYLWNAPADWDASTGSATDGSTNPFGDPVNYRALLWAGSSYTADGNNDSHDGSPARYLRLTTSGGHPGRGADQAETAGTTGGSESLTIANAHDRVPIAAYTIQASDVTPGQATTSVFLTNSFLQINSTNSNGLEVLVHVNDGPVQSRVIPADGSGHDFDMAVGNLQVGDTVYVGFGPNEHDGSDGFQADFTLSSTANSTNGPIRVADFMDDFQGGTPKDGWRYAWNAPDDWDESTFSSTNAGATGPLGDVDNYRDLIWSGDRYSPDGDNDSQNAAPGNFLRLFGSSGHPGRGSGDDAGVGNATERAVISGYTVTTDSTYALLDSSIKLASPEGDGLNVHIYVDETFIRTVHIDADGGIQDFDGGLGFVQAGQTVYVAIGASNQDGFDGFENFDYTLVAVPEPAALSLLVVGGLMLTHRRAGGRA